MSKRSRLLLLFAVKVLVAGGLLAWLILDERLKLDSFEQVVSRWYRLLFALLILLGVPLAGAVRWHMLLKVQGFEVSFLRALHLTLVGIFFNCFSMGLVGGDVVKAYYAAMDCPRGRRAEAVYSVGFDRTVGLYALILMGTVAVFSRPSMIASDPKYRVVAVLMGVVLVVLTFGFLFMFSSRFRDSKTLGPKIEKVPGGGLFLRFYRAIKLYRLHPRVLLAAIALSSAAHCFTFMAIWQVARGLGVPKDVSPSGFVFCVALGLTVSAVGLPLGIGVQQFSFGILFKQLAGAAGESFGTSLATMHQGVMLVFNIVIGLPAFLLVRRDMAKIRAEILEDQRAEGLRPERPPEPAQPGDEAPDHERG